MSLLSACWIALVKMGCDVLAQDSTRPAYGLKERKHRTWLTTLTLLPQFMHSCLKPSHV